MNLPRRPATLTRALVGVAAATLALAACGSDTEEPGGDTGTEVAADDALADLVPQEIRDKGTLVIGTDASYAPNEFLDEDGSTIIGMDVDLFDAVAGKLGLETEWQNADFNTIIVGVNGGKYDIGVSSFTVNEERKAEVNMVSYFNAGTQWAAAQGNPDGIDPDNACGLTVAVQSGTVQEEVDLPARQEACGDNPMDILPFEGQDEATSALATGRAQAMLADSPVVAYAVEQSGGAIEAVGEIYDAAPYGYVVPKDNTEMAEAIVAALESLAEDGTYESILDEWGNAAGGIDDFAVNP
jgi:polar amino acid transport system substrate-binding protein